MKSFLKLTFIPLVALFILACNKEGNSYKYGPFSIQNDTTALINGDMGNRIEKQFNNLMEDYPNIKLLNFGECPGSKNDEAMMDAAKIMANSGIKTHLPSDAIIESGAVDLFLAGKTRTREVGSKIGVHAWSAGNKSATDYAVGHEEHDLYINFYIFCGYSTEEAEELYYFIINAAGPDNMHYMTQEEIDEYSFIKP